MLINNLCLGACPFKSAVGLCPSPFQSVPPRSHWGLKGWHSSKPNPRWAGALFSLALKDCSKILKLGSRHFTALGGHSWGTPAFWACSTAALELWAAEERGFSVTLVPSPLLASKTAVLLPWILSEQQKCFLGSQGEFQRLSEGQQEQGSGAAQGTLGRRSYFCPQQLCLLCKM